jgi:hypothetical protein
VIDPKGIPTVSVAPFWDCQAAKPALRLHSHRLRHYRLNASASGTKKDLCTLWLALGGNASSIIDASPTTIARSVRD